jgi:hypothetical protein
MPNLQNFLQTSLGHFWVIVPYVVMDQGNFSKAIVVKAPLPLKMMTESMGNAILGAYLE